MLGIIATAGLGAAALAKRRADKHDETHMYPPVQPAPPVGSEGTPPAQPAESPGPQSRSSGA
jgi:hypothetical protein